MKARIFQPSRTAMQSGKNKTNFWLLTYLHDDSRTIYPIMGWTSSSDMEALEVKLKFPTKEAAIAFAQANDIAYEVYDPQKTGWKKKSYAENFLNQPLAN